MDIKEILQQAITHHKAGELVDAERLYRTILIEEPKHSGANHNLGVLFKQVDKADSALPFFKIALESNPNHGQFWTSYIDILIYLQQYEAAQSVLNQGQAKGLEGDAVDQLVKCLTLAKGQVTKKSASGLVQAQIDSVIMLYSQGQIQEALSASEALIKDYPNTPLLYNISGACYQTLGQLEAAVNRFEQALAIKPDFAEAHSNLAVTLKALGQLNEAVKHYEQALAIKPDYTEALSNLGVALKALGQLNEAVKYYEQALAIKPDYADAQCNLALALHELGQLDEAVKHYEQALAIKPDFAEAHSNLAVTLKALGQLNEAVKHYEQALAIKPDYAEAHSNLGATLQELGQLDAAVKCFELALAIKPDYVDAWGNLFFTAKALELSTTQSAWLASYKKKRDTTVLKNIYFKILEYRLHAFIPHAVDGFFDNAINALPVKTSEEIKNPSPTHQNQKPAINFNNMIALIHFGRSGTGLLHSLIDNHPEISTLPSIYFSEYYNEEVWGKLIAQGWKYLPERFVQQFAVLFDARSSVPVPSIDKPIANLGQKEGMVNVGVNRDEILTVDQNHFCAELQKLMVDYTCLTPQTFFTLVHSAYEKALNKSSSKQKIFYHIHNPSVYAKLNFLRYNPEAKLLMMVREPIQSCESWVEKAIKESSDNVHNHIVTMLFDIDQIAFRRQDSIGVRLEDLKTQPEATLAALCDWMGVKESSTLYEMTAQGQKWWGDPTSPDYSLKGMSPFEDSAIARKVGRVFSKQDQFILRTLFYPFSVRFGYVEENLAGFQENLKAIKPLLDEPFGFQEKLAKNLNRDLEMITRSGSALYLRAALHDRWSVLAEFHDYPHMLTPLGVNII